MTHLCLIALFVDMESFADQELRTGRFVGLHGWCIESWTGRFVQKGALFSAHVLAASFNLFLWHHRDELSNDITRAGL